MNQERVHTVLAVALLLAPPFEKTVAQTAPGSEPTDRIPETVELPDPCDNPTTRRWGPGDELGNLNYLTPERVSSNLGLVRLGKVYDLAHTLEPGHMGFAAWLDYRINSDDWPGRGAAQTIFNIEETLGASTYNETHTGSLHASLGTQFDGFNHATQAGVTYNCFNTRDPSSHLLSEGDRGNLPDGDPGNDYIFRGHSRGGVENVGTVTARAVLLDVGQLLREREAAAGRDPDRFPPVDYAFSPEELEQALLRQGMTLDDIQPGDALLVRTGWAARYWTSNPADPRDEALKYFNGGKEEFWPTGPGLDLRAVQWTINRNPVLVGADNTSVENSPPISSENPSEKRGHLSWFSSGIYLLENLDLEVLAADCETERSDNLSRFGQPRAPDTDQTCYVFTLMVQTIPIRGFTGSTVAPTAIR
ncbi:MAG: cyclase family protein [Gammaproteobacteria bacterium]